MSTEYITITQAPLYEINKEGSVRTIKKKSPILPYPFGSREVKLNINDTTRQSFNIDELISELFGEIGGGKKKIKLESGQEVEEGSGTTITTRPVVKVAKKEEEPIVEHDGMRYNPEKPTKTLHAVAEDGIYKKVKVVKEKKEKKVKQERKVSNDSPIIAKIMKLKCYESVKMWKLHQNGVSNADITILVNDPHDFVVVKTLEKYKKNKTLQERADNVKL